MGVPEKKFIVETNGSGVCLLDYFNDGWLDIFVANFGKNRLYRNNHDGTFTDVADTAGVMSGGGLSGMMIPHARLIAMPLPALATL